MTRTVVVVALLLVGGAAISLVQPELAPAYAVTALIVMVAGACVSVWG